MIRCVAFDFDGTLVDSNEIKRRAFFEALSDWDPAGAVVARVLDEIRPGDRYAVTREVARLLREDGALPPASDPESWASRWAEDYTLRCEEAVARCAEIPGAQAALTGLAGLGITLYVNSATPEEPLRRLLRRRGLSERFRAAFGGPRSKLENLHRIRADARVAAEEVLFVGDGEDDRSAAAAFGCRFAGLVRPGPSRFARRPESRLEDLSGLCALVERSRGEAA